MDTYIGEMAALGTAICFAFGSTLFTFAGREIGSPLVNRTRLLMAVSAIMVVHWATFGQPLPFDATFENWFWLGLSGFIGFVLGDAFLFQAFVMIGPRLSMLMLALHPVIGTMIAWVFLSENLSLLEVTGIFLTVGGVAWVVSRDGVPGVQDRRYYFAGILFGLGGALGQAGGLVTAKVGLADDFDALSGIAIRLVIATVVIWTYTAARGLVPSSFAKLRQHPKSIWFMAGAVVAGPLTGVYFSLVAVQQAPVGIASALMSLTPIFLLPVGMILFSEKITWRAVVGTIIALTGTAVLFL
jgi:drug/metabolite transporter (DMT)-like permease